jgi:hypothetical protein
VKETLVDVGHEMACRSSELVLLLERKAPRA